MNNSGWPSGTRAVPSCVVPGPGLIEEEIQSMNSRSQEIKKKMLALVRLCN